MKKIILTFLVFVMLLNTASIALATETKENESRIIGIMNERSSHVKNMSSKEFNAKDLNEMVLNDAIVVDESKLMSVDMNNMIELIDNGLIFMVKGKNLNIKDIMKTVEDSRDVDYKDNSGGEITSISVYKVNGSYMYSATVDMSNTLLTNVETNETYTVKEYIMSKGENKEHNPIEFVDSIISSKKELLEYNLKDKPENDVELQGFPTGFDDIIFDWWYDYPSLARMKGVVYYYDIGLYSGKEYWDFVSTMTADPEDNVAILDYRIKLDATAQGQELVDYTQLPSEVGSFTISLAGGENGTSVSYSTSTQSQDVKNYTGESYGEWKVVPNHGLIWDFGESWKIEPGIRVSDTGGTTSIRRYYYMMFYDGIAQLSTNYMYSDTTVN